MIVRVTCPDCGAQNVELDACYLRPGPVILFPCPGCGVSWERRILEGMKEKLFLAGVPFVEGRPEWARIEWDDLLDFHTEVEDIDEVSATW